MTGSGTKVNCWDSRKHVLVYRRGHETDVSFLNQDDLCHLVSQGVKTMQLKKLERWCDTVCPGAENTLPSSSNTPGGVVLLSSESLNVKSETMKQCLLGFPDQLKSLGGGGRATVLWDLMHECRVVYV